MTDKKTVTYESAKLFVDKERESGVVKETFSDYISRKKILPNNSIHHVTSPGAIRTANHRERLKKWWKSKQWKEYVRVHTTNQTCKECGCASGQVKGDRKPATLTINHLYRELYNTFEDYLKFAADKTDVTCTTCNWMFEKGMNVCPVCKDEKTAKYKHWNQPMCNTCFKKAHPEIQEAIDKKKADAKALKKKLMDDQKARVKEYKLSHKKAVKNNGVLGNGGWT